MARVTQYRDSMTEADFQSSIIEAAEQYGWYVMHVFPLRTEQGWRTATTSKGWPDLTMVSDGRMLCLEVKSAKGRASTEQEEWIARLDEVPGVTAAVVWPKDLEWIYGELRR